MTVAPSGPPAADSPTPGTETCGAVSHWPGVRCQLPPHVDDQHDAETAWGSCQWTTIPSAPSPVGTTEPPAETQQDGRPLGDVIYTAWTGQPYWGGCDQRENVERVLDALAARPSADTETLRARIGDLLIDHMPTETARGYVCDCFDQHGLTWREHVAGLIADEHARTAR